MKCIKYEVFLNKDLCDVVRDIVINSALDLDSALKIMKVSKNYSIDSVIVKTLVNVGVNKEIIFKVIKNIA